MKQKLLLVLFTVPFFVLSQNTLKKAKKSLQKKEYNQPTIQTSSTSSSYESMDCDSSYDFIVNPFTELLYYASLGIVFGNAAYTEMNPHPYYNNHGEFTTDFDNNTKRSSLTLSSNYLMNRINSIEFSGEFKPIPLIGLKINHFRFSESSLANSESLNITSVTGKYYRFRENYFTLWWGIGATYVGNEVDTWGPSYQLGTSIYPVKPFSFHFEWQQSFINESTVDVFKTNLKYHLQKTAIFSGFHHYKLGTETISGIAFGIEYTF